jgi:hypothetical protein
MIKVMGDHYIPKFYLKGFADTSRIAFIWVFRNGNQPFITAIRKIAQEDNFYSKEIEQLLANEVEYPANKVIHKIRDQKSISQEEKFTLAKYMMVMWKRVPENKEWVKKKFPEISGPIFERFSKRLSELSELRPEKIEIIEKQRRELQEFQNNKVDELIYDIWLQNIPPEKTPQSVDVFSQMTWRFMIASRGQYFITSDNPLFFFPWMGIGKEMSEVTFPITKDIALWATWRIDIGEGFFPASSQLVKEVNRRTASISTQFLYSPYPAEWIKLLANKPKSEIKLNRIV